jgi:hypothetical protein
MLEPFAPRPDDTVELPVEPPRRQVALIVAAGVVAIAMLVAVGLLAFGGLGGGGGGGGVQPPALLPAVSPSTDIPSSAASPQPTTTPVAVRTPSGTPTVNVAINIANATMRPPSYRGSNCPGSTTAVATVVAKEPVTITYRWASADLPQAGPATYTFTAAGSHQFGQPFANITTPNGQVNATFAIIAPVQRRASMVYTQKCGASVSNISTRPGTAACTVVLGATLHAGVGPMTVQYHWVVNGTKVYDPLRDVWNVPVGGGAKGVSLTRTDKQKINVVLVVDTPIHTQTAPVSVTCNSVMP